MTKVKAWTLSIFESPAQEISSIVRVGVSNPFGPLSTGKVPVKIEDSSNHLADCFIYNTFIDIVELGYINMNILTSY